jgi:autotransporter-associated beta strand protein
MTRYRASHLLAIVTLPLAACALVAPAQAQDATWLANPGSGDFNTDANWNPATVPSGTASFGASTTTNLTLSTTTSLGGWTFSAGAPAYTFAVTGGELSFTGTGIAANGTSVTLASNSPIGAIDFNNMSTAGSATLQNSYVLMFNDSSKAGAASILNTTGWVYFFNNSSAQNATIINNGISVEFADSSSAGNAHITNNTLAYFQNTSTAANAVVFNSSTGDFRFYNTSTAANAVITNNNLLYFNDASTAANATVINNSLVYFYSTAGGGAARFVNNAGATIDFSGSAGPAGDNRNMVGSIEGAGNVALGATRLALGSNNLSTTISGAIEDGGFSGGSGGGLTKVGSGTLTLAGSNGYTGNTTVDAGTLIVNGSIASSALTTVNAGATLGGTGSIGNLVIASGSRLAPGDAIGTLAVQGNLLMAAASSYLVEVSPASADRTSVTGTATLGGATVAASFDPGAYVSKRYTILSAGGGVSGAFGALTETNLPPGFSSDLSYDANDVYLDLSMALPAGLNLNQQRVGAALANAFNASGSIPAVLGSLSPDGLTLASGELGTASIQAAIDANRQFMGVISPQDDRGRDAREIGCARQLPRENCWSVWGAGYGSSTTTDGNAGVGSHALTSQTFGAAAGADYHVARDTLIGFALGGGGTNFALPAGLGAGRSDLFQAGVYAQQAFGAAYLSGALGYGFQDVTTNRTVFADQLRAQFDANSFAARLEGGYRYALAWACITPYLAASATSYALPAYSEQALAGASPFALAYGAQTTTDIRTELGLRIGKSVALPTGTLALRGDAAWAHDFDTDRSVVATFQALPAASFVVTGAAMPSDTARLTAGAEMKWKNGVALVATLGGEFAGVSSGYFGKAVLRYEW